MGSTQQDFEDYQKRKYEAWLQKKNQPQVIPEGQEVPTAVTIEGEQKAFDEYVKTVGLTKEQADKLYFKTTNYERVGNLDTINKTSIAKTSGTNANGLPPECKGNDSGWGVILTIMENPEDSRSKTSVQQYYPIDGSYRGRAYIRSSNASGKWTAWQKYAFTGEGGGGQGPAGPTGPAGHTPKITATANALTENAGVPASVSILSNDTDDQGGKRFDFTFHIPKGDKGERGEQGPPGPAGSGGGGGSSSDVPNVPKNKDYATIRGEFGTNLLDYRELSRDNHVKVNGKVFYIDNSRILIKNNDNLKKLTLYNRVREGDLSATHNITFKSKLIESTDKFYDGASGTNKLQIKLHVFQKSGLPTDLQNITFENDTSGNPSKHPQHTNKLDYKSNYSYIAVDMGGDNVPAKGKIYLSAYYGEIEPKGLSQKFEFKNYNGFELKKNFKGTSDEYIHSTWYDKLKIRLGLLNLKDSEFVKVSEGLQNNTILVKVPKDLWIPEQYFQENQAVIKKNFNDNLMTSNLCDIYQSDDQGTVQSKPFFIKAVTEEIDKKGKPVKCFNILIGKEYMSRWREHLSETQILYPVQDPSGDKFVQLPVGGLIFTLNSGQSIETNKFSKIENYKLEQLKTRGLIFKDSPFGYQDVVIDADNITSVVTNTVPQQVVPISIFK